MQFNTRSRPIQHASSSTGTKKPKMERKNIKRAHPVQEGMEKPNDKLACCLMSPHHKAHFTVFNLRMAKRLQSETLSCAGVDTSSWTCALCQRGVTNSNKCMRCPTCLAVSCGQEDCLAFNHDAEVARREELRVRESARIVVHDDGVRELVNFS